MQFVRPSKFQEAIGKIDKKTLVNVGLSSAQWSAVPVELRDRAFFSAHVENARFLQHSKDFITDFLSGARESIPGKTNPDGSPVTALKSGSRADFVKALQDHAIAAGMGPLDAGDAGTIKDITSEARLGLIFDTQTRQAYDYGDRVQAMDPDVLDEFPAQRFIRLESVKEPRHSHTQFEGQVALKTNTEFWKRINQDFGVPWGPWGWGCGHDVEDVDRAEAEALGLIKSGETIQPKKESYNDGLKASAQGLDPELLDQLKNTFGDQVTIDQDTIRWTAAPEPSVPSKPTLVPTPILNVPGDPKTIPQIASAFLNIGVDNIATKAPNGQTRVWGGVMPIKDQVRIGKTIFNSYSDMKSRFPNMPASIKTVVLTRDTRGRSSLDGPAPYLSIKCKESSDSVWTRIETWENENGMRRSSERKGTQLDDNFRHELAHAMSTPEIMRLWDSGPMKKGWDFFRKSVSYYAVEKKASCEALAESFSIVTRKDYVRGTLPKDIEEFVLKIMLKEP